MTLLELLLQLLQLLGAEGGPAPAELRPVVVRDTPGLLELGAGLGADGVNVVPRRGGRQQGEDQGGRGVEEFGGGCLHPVEGEGQGGQQGSGQGSQTIRWD